jgi:hypothetical protein
MTSVNREKTRPISMVLREALDMACYPIAIVVKLGFDARGRDMDITLFKNPKEFYELFKELFEGDEVITESCLEMMLRIIITHYNIDEDPKRLLEAIKNGEAEKVRRFLEEVAKRVQEKGLL